jgi:2-dehydropantoate 2-reductase
MAVVRAKGLVLDGLLGSHLVRDMETFTDLSDVAQAPPLTAVFISVKSSGTAEAVRDLSRSGLVGAGTLVVSLQNGLGNLEQIREVFGPDRSLGGRVIFGARIFEPGHVHVSVWADKVLIGGPHEGHHLAAAVPEGVSASRCLAQTLTMSGIQTEFDPDIEAALWGKVLYNVGLNPLSALLEVPYGELGKVESARTVLMQLIEEAFLVASKEVDLPWPSAGQYLDLFFSRLLPSTESHLSSMLQDLGRGRETEIDAINGQVILRAERLGLPVPVNRVIYDLVKAKAVLKRN